MSNLGFSLASTEHCHRIPRNGRFEEILIKNFEGRWSDPAFSSGFREDILSLISNEELRHLALHQLPTLLMPWTFLRDALAFFSLAESEPIFFSGIQITPQSPAIPKFGPEDSSRRNTPPPPGDLETSRKEHQCLQKRCLVRDLNRCKVTFMTAEKPRCYQLPSDAMRKQHRRKQYTSFPSRAFTQRIAQLTTI